MANLSQQKRERMLAFLETLKKQHNDDDSLIALGEIERELNSKKYGLVWEEHEEAVDVQMKTHIPVFTEVKEKEIYTHADENYNFLLEGDNLHSLYLLEKTHRGKIDVIYIDPPYNTKNKEFIYEDNKIGEDDKFRHSKWLSFINERFKIAHKLLNETGIIMISIDDNEFSQLKLLTDTIFGENNYITCFIRKTKSMTGDDGNGLNIQHEYLLVYAKNKSKAIFIGEDKTFNGYSNPDNDPKGIWCSADPSAKSGGNSTYFPIENPYTGQIDYPPKGRYWAFSKDTLNKYIESGRILFKKESKKNQRGFIFKRYANSMEVKTMPVSSLFADDNQYMNSIATTELKEIIGTGKFSYPKPTDFIKKLLEYTCTNKFSTILDFFAGSGTTGQAVIELNQQDGGNRKFILCTNNENNICEEVTYQRLKTVITGKRADGSEYSEGIPANLKYFKTDFVSKESEELSDELLEHITEMIELEHGIKVDNKKYVIVLTDEEVDNFEQNISNYPDLKAVFVNQDILLTAKQQKLLDSLDSYIIPDYYFNFELREAGELW